MAWAGASSPAAAAATTAGMMLRFIAKSPFQECRANHERWYLNPASGIDCVGIGAARVRGGARRRYVGPSIGANTVKKS
jgi:hypothetical protein